MHLNKRHSISIPKPGKSLADTHPNLAVEYSSKNSRPASQIIAGTSKKLWWECSVCGHEWRTIGSNRVKGSGCPKFRKHPGWVNPRSIPKEDSSLLDTHPELAHEYSSKNSLTASQVLAGTSKKLWWKCSVCDHEWQASGSRRMRGIGCPNFRKHPNFVPVRSIIKPDKSLADTHPDLAKEYSAKNLLSASQVVAGAKKKLWWKCSVCNFEWQSRGFSRIQGCGCPNFRKHPGYIHSRKKK